MQWNALEENKHYHYDYYLDNCSTRVRDALDRVLGGAIRSATDTVATGTTYRWHTRRLTEGELPIYTGIDLVLGEPGDREISAWAEMFLPMRLRDRIANVRVTGDDGVSRPLVRREVALYTARRAPEAAAPSNLVAGYLAVGVALGLIIIVAGEAAARDSRGARAALAVTGTLWSLLAGLCGLIMTLTWTATDHVFMYRNENLLQFTPLSLLLVFLLPRLFLRGASARLAWWIAALVAALSVAGFVLQLLPAFVQVNGEIIALALPVHVALAWAAYRSAGRVNGG